MATADLTTVRSLAGMITVFLISALVPQISSAQSISNPYAPVDWDSWKPIDSVTHYHAGRSSADWLEAYAMGLRHLPLTEYYPSVPQYPPPTDFLRKHPDAFGSPNAEHHSLTDHSLHFTAPGSWYTTGYGSTLRGDLSVSPLEYTFNDLQISGRTSHPGEAAYRLDLDFSGKDGRNAEVNVTVDGARECDPDTFTIVGDGRIQNRRLDSGADQLWLCANRPELHLRLEFEAERTRIDRVRLMQGVNRPWREAFRAALDGDRVDEKGRPVEGLQYADGGGIVINHPRDTTVEPMLEMLDFDPRVLGIEVWNHRRLFGLEAEAPHIRYYEHWDNILRTGRRSFGFFSKDHRLRGQGRNVLLLPPLDGLAREERERLALEAYRNGHFYGVMGAIKVDEEGRPVAPYDRTEFGFTRIAVEKQDGRPARLRVTVDGHDRRLRPQIQVRFITEGGVAHVADTADAVFELPRKADGSPASRYVRVEAFAFPLTHLQGEPLTPEYFETLHVYEIARLHDYLGAPVDTDIDPPGRAPIPIVDMLFSQAILFQP